MAQKNASAQKTPVKAPARGMASPALIGSTEPPALQKPEEGAAPMTPKNFRNHPDMENFFRFVFENDLRIEALHIMDLSIAERRARRMAKKPPRASA